MAALEGMLPNGRGPKRGGSHLPPWEPEAACQLGRLSTLPPGASQVPPCEEDATSGRGIAEQWLAHSLGIQAWGQARHRHHHSEGSLVAFGVLEPQGELKGKRRGQKSNLRAEITEPS